MKLFILIQFWLGAAMFVWRVVELAVTTYPEARKPKTMGLHIAETIIGLAVVVWAGIVLWVTQ